MLGHRLLIVLGCAAFVAASLPLPIRLLESVDEDLEIEPFQNEPTVSYRLPNNTRPISYNVQLTTNIHTQDDFGFFGVVAARLVAVEVSRTIVLHHRQLTIGAYNLALATSPNINIPLNAFEYDSVTEFLTFTLTAGDLVVDSEYILTINFNGTHRTDNAGFYRSSYLAADGTRRYLATTQFETLDARHAFPCYDEPALRAYFTLQITHGTIYHALSNMPTISVIDGPNGLTTTTFAETAATTPTYLLAIIVSDFESRQLANDRGFVQRVYARPTHIQYGDFALETGVLSLNAFERYFGLNFTFPKMDQVAIPDFAAGAMENWGLVTYREESLLFNEETTTFATMRNIATTIAHEYAHQWFGNLVTPKWWTYLWLNEGFASLFQNYATDWVFPEWKILDAYVFNFVQAVMITDASTATRPMTYYVEEPTAISRLFDNVAYAKSGAVLRMFLNAFTEESFKRGLVSYFNANENSAADEQDLFDALEQAVKEDRTLDTRFNVSTIFSSWSNQAGFPVVTVERNYVNGDVVLSQERYFTDIPAAQSPSIWWIPYNYASRSVADFDATTAVWWLSSRQETFNNPTTLNTDWLLLNKRQTGYYRVKYDLDNYKLLAAQLDEDFERIHLTSRSQLIDDAFDFARSERQGYDVAFDLIKHLEHEVEYVPWASALRGLTLVDRLFSGSDSYDRFTTFIRTRLAHLYSDVKLVATSGEHHYRKQARNDAILWSCRFKNANCLTETNAAVDHYLSTGTPIHIDHRAVILNSGVRSATRAQFDQFLAKLITETDANDRLRLLDAVSFTTNLEWVEEVLQLTLSAEVSHFKSTTERYRVFSAIAGDSQNNTKLVYDFFYANIDLVFARYGQANTNNAITRLVSQTVNAERLEQFEALAVLAATKEFITAATITNARTTLAANKQWADRNGPVIEDWLIRNSSAQLIGSVVLMTVLLFVTQLF